MLESTQCYNLKVVDYGYGLKQYRFFSTPVLKGVSRVKEDNEDKFLELSVKKDNNKIIEDKNRSVENSAKRSKEMIYQYAISNRFSWSYFLTFTFNPQFVDSFNYDICIDKIRKWFNNLKNRNCNDLIYLCVPEKHKSGRFHFHALLGNIDDSFFVDSGHKTKDGATIYNLPKWKYGFTTATKINDIEKCCSYICKYVTKDLLECTPNKHRYIASKNCSLPKVEELQCTSADIDSILYGTVGTVKYAKSVELDFIDRTISYITVQE